MDRSQLLKRKEVLETQIKMFENKIIASKSESTEQLLFKKIKQMRKRLDKINNLLDE